MPSRILDSTSASAVLMIAPTGKNRTALSGQLMNPERLKRAVTTAI